MSAAMTSRDAEQLTARTEAIVQEKASLVDEIAELRTREAEAIEAAIRSGKQARGPGSKSEGVRRTREAKERRLADIEEFEEPACARLALEAQAALRAARLQQALLGARTFDQPETGGIEQIAAGVTFVLRGYAALATAATSREELHAELEQEGILNGLSDGELWQIQKQFQSKLNPFPTSPAAMFEAVMEAVLDVHAGDPQYAEALAQRYPTAAVFVPLLAEVREERLYKRTALRLGDNRTAVADQASGTNDRAGGMAGSGFFS
jgi:hypothetical protein